MSIDRALRSEINSPYYLASAKMVTFSELPKKKRLFSPKEGQISIDYCKTSAIFCFASDNFSIITGKSSSFKNLAERDV